MRLLRCLLTCIAIAATIASAEETMRIDFDEPPPLAEEPTWVAAASEAAEASVEDGVLRLEVPEPQSGMKWRLTLDEAADIGLYPWLVIRYRAGNYAPERADYLAWLKTDARGDGIRLLRGEMRADGRWHTAAVNVLEHGEGTVAYELALQVQSTADGDAWLEVDFVTLVDMPPADAETVTVERGPDTVMEMPLDDASDFTSQPDWLSNPSDEHRVEATEEGLRFSVAEAGLGMKWSAAPPEPVEGARWLAVRYRARGVRRVGDYLVYVASEGGGQAPDEQYVLGLDSVHSGGAWNVAVGAVEVADIRAIAIQVQAETPDAFVEIASMRFSRHRPPRSVADTLAIGGAAPDADFHALDLPVGERALEDICELLGYDDALRAGPQTVESVAFDVAAGPPMTALAGDDAVQLEVGERVDEVYLLLGLRAARSEEPSYGGGTLRSVTHPHRFLATMAYADGPPDEVFPVSVRTGDFEIERGLGVYLLAPDPERELHSVRIADMMDRGALAVMGATTLPPGQSLRAEMHPSRPEPMPLPRRRDVPERTPDLSVHGDRVLVTGARLSAELDAAHCMALERIATGFIGGSSFDVQPEPLFTLSIDDEAVSPAALEMRSCAAEGNVLRAEYVCGEPPATVMVTLEGRADGSVVVSLSARNDGAQAVDIELAGPRIGAIQPRGPDDDLWYLFPRCGCAISNAPTRFSDPYGGRCPLQVMSTFLPRGGGLYLMTRDTQARLYRWHELAKSDGAVSMGVRYLQQPVGPGENFDAVPTQLGGHPGDWHDALDIYRDWVATWYEPATPRKPWFREVFNFRQQFLHFALPRESGLYDDETESFHFDEVLAHDAELFGGLDYLHIFDWGWSEEYGRCGDYDHWEQLGGPDSFRRAVTGVQEDGLPVGLYIEGMLVDPQAQIAEQAKRWEMRLESGEPNPSFAPSMNMCSSHPGWREYLAGVYDRVQEQVGNRGFYIDQYGFANAQKICWREDHPHPVPAGPTWGELQTTRAVREAIRPTTALYTEETPCDVTTQYQDGSFTYNISRARDELSPTHLNLARFALPDFKTIEIIVCDRPLGTNQEAVNRVFFNGEAIWLEGIPEAWFGPRVLALIRKTHRILRENRDAFTSLDVTPLVPTLAGDLYANEFRCDRGTVWTLYNTAYTGYRAPALEVEHVEGARYVDLWTGRELEPQVRDGRAVIPAELSPRAVGCVARWVED